jgi:hypothetical protein
VRQLEDWLEGYLSYTAEQETPREIHELVSWVVVSSAFRRRVWMDRVNYRLYPNLYGIILAKSGKVRKSIGMRLGVRLLRAAFDTNQIRIMNGRITAEGLSSNMNTEVPSANGGSPSMRSAVLLHANELASLFGHEQQQAERMATFLTDIYECDEMYEHITRGGGHKTVHNAYITLLAATAPDNMKVLPAETSGGFNGRTMYVVADARRKDVAWGNPDPEWRTRHEQIRQKLVHDLALIGELEGEFRPSPEAREEFTRWYAELGERKWSNPEVDAFADRAHDTGLKLAMIFSASESDTLVVSLPHMLRAEAEIEKQFSYIGKAQAWMAPTNFQQLRIKFLSTMATCGGRMFQRDIMRIMNISAFDFDSLTQTLKRSALITSGSMSDSDPQWVLTRHAHEFVNPTVEAAAQDED